jgi:hypothetical protein
MAHDVFISYSSEDKPIADAVCATLESKKIRCWIAPRDVLPGIPYGEALSQALHGSRALVLVLSAKSNNSKHVMREVESAVGRGIPIVPFRIEDVQPSKSLDYFLKSIHWLDALTPPMEKHLNTLADTIRLLLDRQQDSGAAETNVAAIPTTGKERTRSDDSAPRVRSFWLKVGAVVLTALLLLGAGAFAIWKGINPHGRNSVQPSPTTQSTPDGPTSELSDEVAIRQLITQYFDFWCKKDAIGILSTSWPRLPPQVLEDRRLATKDLFANTGKIFLKELKVGPPSVDGEFAEVGVSVQLWALSALDRKPVYPNDPFFCSFNLAKEAGQWKIIGYTFENYDLIMSGLAPVEIRAVIQRHFDSYAKKDVQAWLSTFRQTNDATVVDKRREGFKKICEATGKIELKQLTVDPIKVDGKTATAHAAALLEGTLLTNNEPYFPKEPMVFDFRLVMDGSAWKISGYTVQTGSNPAFVPVAEKPSLPDKRPELNFQKFSSAPGQFTVEFPGFPKQETEDWGSGIKGRVFVVRLGQKYSFQVSYGDFKGFEPKVKDPIQSLKAVRSGYRPNGKFIDEKVLSLGDDKIPVLEYKIEGNGWLDRERMLFARERFYIISLRTPDDKEFLESKESNRYFDSFDLTDAEKEPN